MQSNAFMRNLIRWSTVWTQGPKRSIAVLFLEREFERRSAYVLHLLVSNLRMQLKKIVRHKKLQISSHSTRTKRKSTNHNLKLLDMKSKLNKIIQLFRKFASFANCLRSYRPILANVFHKYASAYHSFSLKVDENHLEQMIGIKKTTAENRDHCANWAHFGHVYHEKAI